MAADKEVWINCDCSIPEHSMRLTLWRWEEPAEDTDLYVEIHLNPDHGFFRRIWTAIRYILGKRSRFGDFDCIVLSKKSATQMRDTLQEYIDDNHSR